MANGECEHRNSASGPLQYVGKCPTLAAGVKEATLLALCGWCVIRGMQKCSSNGLQRCCKVLWVAQGLHVLENIALDHPMPPSPGGHWS